MKLKCASLNQLAYIALKSQKNFIPIPVEPQPLHPFERIRMFNGSAAFWLDSSYCEIRSCPWGKPGTLLQTRYSKLKISHIEVKLLQESISLFTQRLRESKTIDNDLHFMTLWDNLFKGSEYAWHKNPLTWMLYFEHELIPMTICAEENLKRNIVIEMKRKQLYSLKSNTSNFSKAA